MLDRLGPAVVMLTAFGYAVGLRRLWALAGPYRLVHRAQAAAFAAAVTTLLVALASPLDAAVDHDLPLHMVQHVLLLAVVPPLLAVSAPVTVLAYALPTAARRRVQSVSRRALRSQATATGWFVWTVAAFAAATLTLALWHVPALYDAAVRNDTVHALEHITFVATATLFWWMALGGGRRSRRGVGVIAVFVTTLPATALGVLMTLATTTWYAPYGRSATALRDQQVAGAVMWGFGGVATVAAAAGLFAAWLAAMERAEPRVEHRPAVKQW
jgi:putative membrane protein